MSLSTASTAEEARKFIDLGHDVNSIKRDYGLSVLHYFCSEGKLDIVKVLCEAGANINNDMGGYPIDEAAIAGYLDIVKYLIENHPIKLDNVLHRAVMGGNCDVIDYLLTLNVGLEKPVFDLNRSRHNPLCLACQYGHIDIVDRFLYAGADTNIVDWYDNTPIFIATTENQLDIIKRLVMFGADYHTYGGRSLVRSCEYSYDDISEFLINLGCDVNYCFNDMTPLMRACQDNNLKTVKLLLERGANPDFINDKGKKAIDYCSGNEVRFLFIKN